MRTQTQGRRIFPAALSALALGCLLATAADPLPVHADASAPAAIISRIGSDTVTYADDGDKGKKGDKGGTEPIIIGPPIIVHDPPKTPPKKDK
jgi:hypothetical protein